MYDGANPLMPEVGVLDGVDAAAAGESTVLVAHSLLNAVSTIAGVAATLRHNWERLPAERRMDLLERLERSSVRVGIALRHLGCGQPVEALFSLREAVDLPTPATVAGAASGTVEGTGPDGPDGIARRG